MQTPLSLTRAQALGMLLRWQGLSGPPRFRGRQGAMDYVRQAGCVQFDPLDPCGRNAELVLHARVPDLTKADLSALLYEEHALLDHWDKNMSLIEAADFPRLARRRRAMVAALPSHGEVERAKEPVLAAIRARGPMRSSQFSAQKESPEWSEVEQSETRGEGRNPVPACGGSAQDGRPVSNERREAEAPDATIANCGTTVPQPRSPANPQDLTGRVIWWWAPTSVARATLETLYQGGALVIHSRSGTARTFDLPERHLPAELLAAGDGFADDAAYYAWRVLRRIRAVGLLWRRGSDAWLGIEGLTPALRGAAFDALLSAGEIAPIQVEDIAETLYAPREALPFLDAPASAPRTELIAPLDALLWDRRLVEALFGFAYRWEVYVPREKRKYGYYVHPVLQDGALVGRVEIKRDKARRCLRVDHAWWERPLEAAGFRECMDRLCAFDGAERWEMGEGVCLS